MRLLLDTHVLVWALNVPPRISGLARDLIDDEGNELLFSVVSLWEIVIKSVLARPDFSIDARLVRRTLLENEYVELQVSAEHAFAVSGMPTLHKDPFDRLLLAQAAAEKATFVTKDKDIAKYPGAILTI